jgi:Ni/Fe-hydrogenase subunit HybB-like protein
VYAALRIGDVVIAGELGRAFNGSFASNMFLLEVSVGALIPIFIAFSRLAGTNWGQIWFGLTTVAGVVMLRFNVVTTALQEYMSPTGQGYWPKLTEITVSIGLVCIACLLYLLIAENFNILDRHRQKELEAELPVDVKTDGQTFGA